MEKYISSTKKRKSYISLLRINNSPALLRRVERNIWNNINYWIISMKLFKNTFSNYHITLQIVREVFTSMTSLAHYHLMGYSFWSLFALFNTSRFFKNTSRIWNSPFSKNLFCKLEIRFSLHVTTRYNSVIYRVAVDSTC